MDNFKNLNENEIEELLKFPAYISLLASTAEKGIDDEEKKAVVKLTHVKTYSCDPLLADFYNKAETIFERTITNLDHELPIKKEERKSAIIAELNKLEPLLKKLPAHYAAVLRKSMDSYKKHISKAHRNVLEYFIFPLPIEGISD